jgi:hypothetical protein
MLGIRILIVIPYKSNDMSKGIPYGDLVTAKSNGPEREREIILPVFDQIGRKKDV